MMMNSLIVDNKKHNILVAGDDGCGSDDGCSGGGGRGGPNKLPRQQIDICSICLERVVNDGERAWTKLKCGHIFHLDCIGSAFNSKGAMECPNCRSKEEGEWRYANGLRTDFHIDAFDLDQTDDIFNIDFRALDVDTLMPAMFQPTFQIDLAPVIEFDSLEIARRRRSYERQNNGNTWNLGESSNNNNNNGITVGSRVSSSFRSSYQRPRTSRGRFGSPASASSHPPNRRSYQRNWARARTNQSNNQRFIWRPVGARNSETMAAATVTTAANAATIPVTGDRDVMNLFRPGLNSLPSNGPYNLPPMLVSSNPGGSSSDATAAAANTTPFMELENVELLNLYISEQPDPTPTNQRNNQRQRNGRPGNAGTTATATTATSPNSASFQDLNTEELLNLLISEQEEHAQINQASNQRRNWRPVTGRNTETAVASPRPNNVNHQPRPPRFGAESSTSRDFRGRRRGERRGRRG